MADGGKFGERRALTAVAPAEHSLSSVAVTPVADLVAVLVDNVVEVDVLTEPGCTTDDAVDMVVAFAAGVLALIVGGFLATPKLASAKRATASTVPATLAMKRL